MFNLGYHFQVVNPFRSFDAPDGGDGAPAGGIITAGGAETISIGRVPLGGKSAVAYHVDNVLLGPALAANIVLELHVTAAGITSRVDRYTWAAPATDLVVYRAFKPVVGEYAEAFIIFPAGQAADSILKCGVHAASF